MIGGGVVGTHAARGAAGMGAEVTILERSLDRLLELEQLFDGRVAGCLMSDALTLERGLREADMVIGAVLIPGALAPKLVTREMLGLLRPQSVLVDVAIDQGGCFATSHPTTHTEPTYVIDGIVHYCVANMPGAVPATSTRALTNVTLPYVRKLADLGVEVALEGRSWPRARSKRGQRRDRLCAGRGSLRPRAARSRLVAAPDRTLQLAAQTPGPAFTGCPAWSEGDVEHSSRPAIPARRWLATSGLFMGEECCPGRPA